MYNCFRTQPRKALMNNLRGLKILLALSLSVCLNGNPIKIIGTYDLNKNNLNEILILKLLGKNINSTEVTEMYENRKKNYNIANIKIDTSKKNVNQIVEEIKDKLNE